MGPLKYLGARIGFLIARVTTPALGRIDLPVAVVGGSGFEFTKIADTSTPIPGGVGNFVNFSGFASGDVMVAPGLDGNNVAFAGGSSTVNFGSYRSFGGSLALVAKTGNAM